MSFNSPTLSSLIKQGEQQFQHRFPTLKRNKFKRDQPYLCGNECWGAYAPDWLARQIIPTKLKKNTN
ncbi:hypothetical protein [Pasteurella multocida]|uniref:hypothetical protein n=1 Tax=Pasteurella multocida TaxID=747 RepID=UPI001D11B33D|nr:hypothetical protein [Pasteurella multocida]